MDIFDGPFPDTAPAPKPGALPLTHWPYSTFGEPIFRVSFTLKGERRVMLMSKPNRWDAKIWAQHMAREEGWTELRVGRWRGRMPLTPTPWVTRAV